MKLNLLTKTMLCGAAVAMVACSTDEPVNGDQQKPIEGDVAYMTVNIQDVNGRISRATTPNDTYDYGTGNETAVSNAKFLFFDKDGNYMNIQANKWEEGGTNSGTPTNNIEHYGKNTIVLRGLKGTDSYPHYMIVVLNDYDFQPASTLAETSKRITDIKKGDNFIMSTTSYFGDEKTDTDRHVDDYYYAVKLKTTDFKKEPADGTSSKVDVFVERVAAKVTLVNEAEGATTIGGYDAFPVNITVGGTGNDDPDTDDTIVEGDNRVYVQILGWDLNCTPYESYICKQLDSEWKTTAPFTNWQKPGDYRSFWGQSVVYDKAIGNGNVTYKDYASLNGTLNTPLYTHEHTNTIDNIKLSDKDAVNRSKVTSVLLKTKIVDKDGNGLDLVEIMGIWYTYDGLKNRVLSNMDAADKLNYYTVEGTTDVQKRDENGNLLWEQYDADVTGENGTILHKKGDYKLDAEGNKIPVMETLNNYKQVDASYLSFVKKEDGKTAEINVVASVPENTTFYKKNADGTFTAYTADEKAGEAFVAAVEEFMATYPTMLAADKGASYYNIPIEHLNEDNKENGVYTGLAEGNYGVVRNHSYKLTISKIQNVGHPVFVPGNGGENPTPGEAIIPDDETDDTFWLGATINILSWKIVNQNVEL